jgi:hypothetical protein
MVVDDDGDGNVVDMVEGNRHPKHENDVTEAIFHVSPNLKKS